MLGRIKAATEDMFTDWTARVIRHCLLGSSFEVPTLFLNHPAFIAFKKGFDVRVGLKNTFLDVSDG
jgi:hypothetical protein